MWLIVSLLLTIAVLCYKVFWSSPEDFFKRHGIPVVDTSVFASKREIIFGRKPTCLVDNYAYSQMSKFCGVIDKGQPLVLVKDVDLLKKVLIRNFDHFADRRNIFTKHDGFFNQMLFSLNGDEWKGVKSATSPIFTTGKIRGMMEYFNAVGKEWVEYFTPKGQSIASQSVNIEVFKAVNQYGVQLISTAIFGINANVIQNPDCIFFKMANRYTEPTFFGILNFLLSLAFPRVFHLLGLSVTDKEANSFFEKILSQGLQSRMKGNTRRNDFLQLLVDTNMMDAKEHDAGKKQFLTDEIMTAACMEVFIAGYANTSSIITFTIYALALYPEVQTKLRLEVDKIMREDGTLEYDDLQKLVYMKMVINETFRKFPAVSRLERICSRDYHDLETGMKVPKGTLIGIPVYAIHHDKQHYRNPEKFDPEHFNPEQKAGRSPYAFLPFGFGPRSCRGLRFAMIHIKSALAHIVHGFIIEPTEKTPAIFQGVHTGVGFTPPRNLQVRLARINKT